MTVKPAGLLLLGGGGVLIWSAIQNKQVTSVLRELAGGNSPASANSGTADTSAMNAASLASVSYAYGYGTGGTGGGGAGSGSAIAAAAAQYEGHKYVYGGPSNPTSGWDCSSFVSYILGQQGIPIPGGTWASVTGNGAQHGPVAASYLTWSGAATIKRSAVQAGDLLCWETHVGFALDNSQMISAYDESSGTCVTGIDGAGPTGEAYTPVCRAINGVSYS